MALWGSRDLSNNAPKYAVAGGVGVSANGQALFGNTQVSAFATNLTLGTFGVDTTEVDVAVSSGSRNRPAHAGWNLRKVGVGPVLSISANTGSFSPSGNVYLTFTGDTGATVANAQVFVNSATKRILSVVVNDGGLYSTTPSAVASGANVEFTITMGGRANRVQMETLVAMGSMTDDGSDDTLFPDS
jgi:hypothetical protein